MKEKKIKLSLLGKAAAVLCIYHSAMAVYNFSEGNIDSGLYDALWAGIEGVIVASDVVIETKETIEVEQ